MRLLSSICAVGLTLSATWLGDARLEAQSVTFAQITDPQTFVGDAGLASSEHDLRMLERDYALSWAVSEINRNVRAGKRIDFLIISGGFGLKAADPSGIPTGVAERMRVLRAAMVPAIFVIPGEEDFGEDADFGAYRQFVATLKRTLDNKKVQDLLAEEAVVSGIQIIGLRSGLFTQRQKISESDSGRQLHELDRVGQLVTGHRSIIFLHTPDLDDPARLTSGKSEAQSWTTGQTVRSTWYRLVGRPEVLAVFAGNISSVGRAPYLHDYSWALNRPDQILENKMWIAPPLAAFAAPGQPPLTRGLEIASVAEDGSVSALPSWFLPTASLSEVADKSDKIAEARAYEETHEFEKAAAAYKDALVSKDAWVRLDADTGFSRTVRRSTDIRWESPADSWFVKSLAKWWLDVLIAILVLFVFALGEGRFKFSRWLSRALRKIWHTPAIVVGPVAKGNPDAPAEEFSVQLKLALEEIRAAVEPQQSVSGTASLALTSGAPSNSVSVVTATPDAHAVGVSIGELPDLKVGGVDVRTILAWWKALRNLLSRTIEVEVWGVSERIQVFAVQRFAGIEEARWTIPAPGLSSDVREASQELAYNIVGWEYTR